MQARKQDILSLQNTGNKPASKPISHGSCEKVEAHQLSLETLGHHDSPSSLKPLSAMMSVIWSTVKDDLKTKIKQTTNT